jgi:hypothetical protein
MLVRADSKLASQLCAAHRPAMAAEHLHEFQQTFGARHARMQQD